jgi:hypothetical protein
MAIQNKFVIFPMMSLALRLKSLMCTSAKKSSLVFKPRLRLGQKTQTQITTYWYIL